MVVCVQPEWRPWRYVILANAMEYLTPEFIYSFAKTSPFVYGISYFYFTGGVFVFIPTQHRETSGRDKACSHIDSSHSAAAAVKKAGDSKVEGSSASLHRAFLLVQPVQLYTATSHI